MVWRLTKDCHKCHNRRKVNETPVGKLTTRMVLAISQRQTEDRTKWEKVVANTFFFCRLGLQKEAQNAAPSTDTVILIGQEDCRHWEFNFKFCIKKDVCRSHACSDLDYIHRATERSF